MNDALKNAMQIICCLQSYDHLRSFSFGETDLAPLLDGVIIGWHRHGTKSHRAPQNPNIHKGQGFMYCIQCSHK